MHPARIHAPSRSHRHPGRRTRRLFGGQSARLDVRPDADPDGRAVRRAQRLSRSVRGPGGSVAPSAGASGGTGGTVLNEVASGVSYQTTSFQAPANQPFQIAFDNQDAGIPHNIQIADGSGAFVFEGDTVTGVAQTTYNVPALAAGTYKFSCKWHSTMAGELTVQ